MLKEVKVFVAGDLMLDRFEYGKVSRISPEAPVPVFRFEREKQMLGGVGNVAANLLALGCRVTLAGVVGRDVAGQSIRDLVAESCATSAIKVDPRFQTVVKTRLIAGNNHLLRADQERDDVAVQLSPALRKRYATFISKANVVLLSDYAKGFLSAANCRAIISSAKAAKKPVLVDPKGVDWDKYRGATLVKPNLKEFAQVCGRNFDAKTPAGRDDLIVAARRICRRFGIHNLLITLSEHGMLLVPSSVSQDAEYVPTEVREVFDVSGAGDTALAAFGAAVGAGQSMHIALRMANVASGIVVSKLGTATVSREELAAAMGAVAERDSSDPFSSLRGKVVSAKEIAKVVERERMKGRRIGFTNGCFDCLHLGHLYSLIEAKKNCDVLVVGLNSDASVRRHKGPSRPIQDERTRAMNLAANSLVDYVVVFDEDVPLEIVKAVRPDVIAKEGYPLPKWPEGRLVKKLGGQAIVLKRLPGYSTSGLVDKMNANAGHKDMHQ